MTKLEELEAALDKVWLDVGAGVFSNTSEALNAIESCQKAFEAELKK